MVAFPLPGIPYASHMHVQIFQSRWSEFIHDVLQYCGKVVIALQTPVFAGMDVGKIET